MANSTRDNPKQDTSGHARVNDPVEPPARHARKLAKGDDRQDTCNEVDDAATLSEPKDPTSILSRLFDPDRKQKPALWTHIRLVAPGPADQPPAGQMKWRSKDAIAAYCLKCKKQFTYTKGTSKTISRHMFAFHGLASTSGEYKPGRGPSDDGTMTSPPPLKKRKPSQPPAIPPSLALLKWLVSSFRPLSSVDDAGMQQFCSALDGFIVPSLSYMTRYALEQVDKVQAEVKRQLKDSEGIHYSLYCQKFENQGEQYSSVGVTFCSPSSGRKNLSLATRKGVLDEAALEEVLKSVSLPIDRVSTVTVKGLPKNIAKSYKSIVVEKCVLDQMDALVLDVFEGQSKNLLNELKDFHMSNPKKITYSDELSAFLPPILGHSSSLNVKQLYKLFQASLDEESLASKHKKAIEEFSSILKPFTDASTTLRGESYPTIGLTIPVFRRIRDVLSKLEIEDKTTKPFMKTLLASFTSTFETFLVSHPSTWTVPLDPRLVHMGGLSEGEKKEAKERLVAEVAELKASSKTKVKKESEKNSKPAEQSTMGGIFWGDDAAPEEDSKNSTNVSAYAKDSVDRYLAAVKSESRTVDPLTWWTKHSNSFPELAVLARRWLGASAIMPEADGRSSYSDPNIEMIAYLHDNSDLF